jgi:hypothetical protein
VSFTVTRHVTRSEAKVIRVTSGQSSLAERARNSRSVSVDFNIDFSTEKSLIDLKKYILLVVGEFLPPFRKSFDDLFL